MFPEDDFALCSPVFVQGNEVPFDFFSEVSENCFIGRMDAERRGDEVEQGRFVG